MSTLGLYLHVPFCRQKCSYCDFYSLPRREDRMDDYTAALARQLEAEAYRFGGYTADTVYFGGGTPSYLGSRRLCALLDAVTENWSLAPEAEISLEANPDSACDGPALLALRRAGFNRLSLGVQACDDELLRRIGRIHTFAQARQAVEAARAAGFDNISLDLIYGLPGQTLIQWQKTLADALTLAPEHISCYGLRVEEGTPLWRSRDAEKVPDDDAQADMYLWAAEALASRGYRQYEISNFALPGRESRHNLRYWRLQPYLGFGPGAHSDFGGVRYAWEKDLEGYIAGGARLSEREEIPAEERRREYLMLALRTAAGVDRERYERVYRRSFAPLGRLLSDFADRGLAAPTEAGWRLTPRGFLVSNSIICAVQEAAEETG